MKIRKQSPSQSPLRKATGVRSEAAPRTEKAAPAKAATQAPESRFEAGTGGRAAPTLTAPEFADLTATLAAGARAETATFALTRLASRGGAFGEAAKKLLADPALARLNLPAQADALAAALTGELLSRDPDLSAREVKLALVDDLTAFRFGSRTELGFALEPVALPDDLPPPRNLTPSHVDSGVAGLALAEHSMHDVAGYVNERLGAFLVKDLVESGRPFEIHQGSTEQAFSSLKARGFTELMRVRGPKTADYGQLYLARNPSTGDVRYAMTNNWGTDRVAHMEKLVSLASVEGKTGARHVRPSQIQVFQDPMLHPEQVYRRYSRALLASGTVPLDVVIGFKSGMMRELGRRGVAARQLKHVQLTLGPDPVKTLRTRAAAAGEAGRPLAKALDALGDAAGVLAMEPARVFRHDKHILSLRKVEDALTIVARTAPAGLFDDVVTADGFKLKMDGRVAERAGEDRFLDQSVISYMDDAGAARSLLVTRNPYGDLAHEMGRVLVDNDVENIFVVGTSGGLKQDGKVGEVHAPGELYGADGEKLPFTNRAIEVLASTERKKELGALVHVGTKMAEVNSPLDETMGWVGQQRAKGYDLVEMELADLVRATRGSKTNVSGMYVVSDMPGTTQTLESQSGLHARAGLSLIGDVLIEQLGIRDVVLTGDPQPVMAKGFKGAEALANRMLASRGLDDDDHLLMRHNLARYLYNGLTDADIDSLQADSKRDPLTSPQLASRWQEKIERALGKPFKNDEVVEHLRELGRGLGGAVKLVHENAGPDSEFTFHILGSIVKGRAGLGSDVDCLIRSKDTELKTKLFESQWGYAGAPDDALVVAGDYDYAMSRGSHYGPVVSIGSGKELLKSDTVLVDMYADALQGQGLLLAKGKNGDYEVKRDPAGVTKAPERETQAVAERVLEYEKAYRKWMDTDFLLRHLNDIAPLADVGHLPFERLVAQGEKLVQGSLSPAMTKENVAAYLRSPEGTQLLAGERGKMFLDRIGADAAGLLKRIDAAGVAGLPLEHLVDGQMASALMGRGDPLAALAVDFASAERAKAAMDGGLGPYRIDFPFFANEVRAACKPKEMLTAGNPLLARAANMTANKSAPAPAKDPTFFEQHLSRGSGARAVGIADVRYGADGVGRVDLNKLLANDALLHEVADFAQARGVSLGFWGGSARDLLLGRTRDKTSDVDLVFDSSEPAFAGFKDALIDHLKAKFDRLPEIDFSVDTNPAKTMRGPYRGLTIEKLAIMTDGRVADFTGRGLDDLDARVLRYNSSEPFQPPGISSVFRMAGAQIQNPDASFDDATRAVIDRVMKDFYGPGSDAAGDMLAFRQQTKHMNRREVGRFVREERARLGGPVPGENLVDFFRTLGKIVKGGAEEHPARTLQVLDELGLIDFLARIDAGDRLQPLRDAAR